ncbi:hypothetical protein HA402_006932 [Bradysia odoriphaga]|nr:hypothetical protein HA402_006932 [Bradysia odoriphaga]
MSHMSIPFCSLKLDAEHLSGTMKAVQPTVSPVCMFLLNAQANQTFKINFQDTDSIIEMEITATPNNITATTVTPISSCKMANEVTMSDADTTKDHLSEKQDGRQVVTEEINNSIHEANEVCEEFNPNAFKEAFFWPVDDPKKAKKAIAPKMSSVMSSEDWRQHERIKLQEKQQQQAEKDARKAAREAKKLETAKLAAEKIQLKARKAVESTKTADAKQQKISNKNKTQKRSRKATNKLNL